MDRAEYDNFNETLNHQPPNFSSPQGLSPVGSLGKPHPHLRSDSIHTSSSIPQNNEMMDHKLDSVAECISSPSTSTPINNSVHFLSAQNSPPQTDNLPQEAPSSHGLVTSAAAAVKGILRKKSSSAASFRRRRLDLRISIPEEPNAVKPDAPSFFNSLTTSSFRTNGRKTGGHHEQPPVPTPTCTIGLETATPKISQNEPSTKSTFQAKNSQCSLGYTPSIRSTSSFRDMHQHSFLVDETDLRRMENGLLHLLEDFTAGKLRAFVGNQTLDKMNRIRDQQQTLAKLHFELHTEQESLMDEGKTEIARQITDANLKKLTDGLKNLNESIRELCQDETIR